MDGLVFGEFMEHLTKVLRKTIEAEEKDDTLSLESLLPKPETGAPPPPLPDDEQEFLRQHSTDQLKIPQDQEKKRTDL